MAREIVTSENLNEYIDKKLAEKRGEKPKKKADRYEKYKSNPKWAQLSAALGKKGAADALDHQRNMGDSETSMINKNK